MSTTKPSKSRKAKSSKSTKPKSKSPCVLKPAFDLTVEETNRFLEESGKLLNGKQPKGVVDLEQVNQIDGAGLAALLVLQQSVNEKEGTLTVVTESSDWRDLFQSTGADAFLTVQESL